MLFNKLLFYLIIITTVGCQYDFFHKSNSSPTECQILQNASTAYESEDYANALQELIRLKSKYPHHTLSQEIEQRIGELYWKIGNMDSAINISLSVIEHNDLYKDTLFHKPLRCEKELAYTPLVFAERPENILNQACLVLYQSYLIKGDYANALNQLILSETQYPASIKCGNEFIFIRNRMALNYSEIYEKMGQTHKAIESLLPVCFPYYLEIKSEDEPYLTIDEGNITAIQKVIQLSKNNNQLEYLKKELKEGLKELKNVEENNIQHYYLQLFNQSILVGFVNAQRAKKNVQESQFYQILMATY